MSQTKKSFTNRTFGLMKKATELTIRFPEVKISVYVSDSTDTLVYQSNDSWPPAMEATVAEIKAGEGGQKRKQLIYGPSDFITISDAKKRAITSATTLGYGTNCLRDEQGVQESSDLGQNSVLCPTLDSASLAVLKHIAPSISDPVPESTEHTLPLSKRPRISTRSKKQWNKYGFVAGKTGEASQE